MTDSTSGTPPPQQDVPSRTLMATLAIAGALAGLLIVFVYGWTQPTIRAHKAAVLAMAIEEVLQRPASYDTLYVYEGELVSEIPEGAAGADLEALYRGYDVDGSVIGYAIVAGEPGFQDVIGLIFGYDARAHRLLGMKVLESKETPGLGDKTEKDTAFVGQFSGVLAPLVGVKSRDATGDPHEIDMITGATISSRTIVRSINNTIARLGPMLDDQDRNPIP